MSIQLKGHWWGAAIEAPDPQALADFYSALLGWPVVHTAPEVAVLRPPQGSVFMVFQLADDYVAPTWPPVPGEQRAMMHLDFQVEDPDAAVEEAVALGARLASSQPQENVRVLLDPVGHPFCVCRDDG
jgi:catechol 2,3-dioxygenase-like lactoylglutathione lyase family enzyme